jgi:hypothetical protein
VDGMVAEFTDINRGMEKTGTFTMERKKLFQLVGKANSNLADVILKLGLFERYNHSLTLRSNYLNFVVACLFYCVCWEGVCAYPLYFLTSS